MSRDQLMRSPHGSSHTEKSHLLYTCAFDIIKCLPVLLEMGGGRFDASARRASESRNPLTNFSSNWTWASLASRTCHLLFHTGRTGNRDQDAPPMDALECATLLVSMQLSKVRHWGRPGQTIASQLLTRTDASAVRCCG